MRSAYTLVKNLYSHLNQFLGNRHSRESILITQRKQRFSIITGVKIYNILSGIRKNYTSVLRPFQLNYIIRKTVLIDYHNTPSNSPSFTECLPFRDHQNRMVSKFFMRSFLMTREVKQFVKGM